MLANKIIRATFCKIFKKKPVLNAIPQQNQDIIYKSKDSSASDVFHNNNLNKIIQKCNPKNKKLMLSILEVEENDPNQKRIAQTVGSMIDFNSKKIFSTYEWAVATILLKNCRNSSIRTLKYRAMTMFLFYSDSQQTIFNKIFKGNPIGFQQLHEVKFNQLQQQDIQFIFLEISRQFLDTANKQKEKNKKNKFKIRLLNLINQFSPKIRSINAIKQMLSLLLHLQDNYSMITKFRNSKSISILAQKMKQKINQDPSMVTNIGQENNKYDRFNSFDIINILKSLSYSQNQSIENFRFFVDIFASPNFFHPDADNNFKIKMYQACFIYTRDYFDQNGKNPVLERLKYLFLNDEQFRHEFCNKQGNFIYFFFSNIIIAKFNLHYKNMPSKQIEGCVLIQQLPPLPQFDECEKKMIQLTKTKMLKQGGKIKDLLQKFYPELLSSQDKLLRTRKVRQAKYTDNELAGKLGLVFDRLGLKYEKQVGISGRTCDFLIEGNTILECDGDYHIDFKTFDVNDKTAERNVIFLYNGYKLITINTHEFNYTRSLTSLAELLTKKLGLLKKHNALLVS